MALGYAVALRNAQMDAITTYVGNGAILEIYAGARPATGGAEGTLLATFTCGTPFAPAAAAGVLSPTLPAVTSAVATGTAAWFRLYKSDGVTHVLDGSVGTSGSDLNLDTVAITSGLQIEIDSWTITRGNA